MKSFLLLVVALSVIGAALLVRRSRQPPPSPLGALAQPGSARRATSNKPVSFGYKCAWFAVEGVTTEQLAAGLNLKQRAEADWTDGIARAYEGDVFVTPPVQGWVFAVSNIGLPDAGDANHDDAVTPLVARLSRALGKTVFYFASHRVVEYHAWAKATGGKIVRAFAYVGDQGLVKLDVGSLTPEERELQISREPDEEDVMRLAGRWAISPQGLEVYPSTPTLGVVGRL